MNVGAAARSQGKGFQYNASRRAGFGPSGNRPFSSARGKCNMSETRSFLEETISSLKQQRDELSLQMHLGKAELKDEWNKLQKKLDQLSEDYEPVRDAVGESAENVLTSLKLVADELVTGFNRIWKSL
jgi:hypothetical protein